ncbi:hypothetical protein [Virgibacillus sp. Bac332]|uniref:hypothetical protein n=1 Tax=Virgibacillus sp. Bac332 TaxID=2419842 RepID=UPI000EF4C017|nr:hypothetical protein [Virgibacillus sp. Bac332]
MLLFVVPIYRVSPKRWEEEFIKKWDKELEEVYDDKAELEKAKQRYIDKYFVHHKYNDVIAWIEVNFEVYKIKGRVITTNKKSYRRGFKPVYESNYKLGDIDISVNGKSNEKIIEELIERIERLRKQSYNNRYIDTSLITDVGRYVDFQKIYNDSLNK